jgi:hypothetical protein
VPVNTSVQVESGGDTIDDATGELVGAWSIAPAAGYAGANASPYAAPAGACITWLTPDILDGRRIKGRTFIVPIGSGFFQTDGSLTGAGITAIATPAAAYVAALAGNGVIWHRPRAARAADGSRPAVTARAGGHGIVNGSVVADKVAILKSRRD